MAKRLIKIAKELNVGVNTIVDYLNNNGFEIDNKPTAKVTEAMESALTKEFQKSIAIKEKADQIKIGRASTSKVPQQGVDVLDPPHNKEGLSSNTDQPEDKVQTQQKTEEKEEKVSTRERPILNKPKILGKIDLRSNNSNRKTSIKKPKPVQEKEEVPETSEERPLTETKSDSFPEKVQDQKENKTEPKSIIDTAEKVADDPKSNEEIKISSVQKAEEKIVKPKSEKNDLLLESQGEGQPDLIKTETPELRGLKIKGKIDIDKFSKKPKKKERPKDKPTRDNRNRQEQNRSGQTKPGPSRPSTDRRRDNDSKESGSSRLTTDRRRDNNSKDGNSSRPATDRRKEGDNTNKGDANNNRSTSDNNERRKRPRKRTTVTNKNESNNRTSSGDNNRSSNNNNNRRRNDRPDSRDRNKKNNESQEVSKKEIEDKIRATMARISGGGKKKRQKIRRESRDRQREKQEQLEQEQHTDKLQVTEFISVSELASMMDVAATDVIMTCMNLGVIVSINQRLDAEVIELVAEEHGREVEFIGAEAILEEEEEEEDNPADLKPRAPIVTVMGHVDHGKTSLLDYIRSAKVAEGEAGGITQHIGAYEVRVGDENKKVTFLDTPGHEAFTAMRARGAKVTDIAIIIIAADDSIMPQTKEAISHAQAAGVPMVFAINKIDKPGADPNKIKQSLASMNFLVEEWGGEYQSQDISAMTGEGIEELLEKVVLEAEVLELKANPDRNAVGVILEASLDKGRGYVTKTLIEKGTLNVGDPIVAGAYSGKVKAMFNELGKRVKKATPSQPVLILGLNGAPQAGERFKEVDSESDARQIASKRGQISREQANRATKRISLDEIGRRLALGSFKELNLIVKGDFDGSIEALSDSLIKQSIESVQVNVIHKAVGQIIESDILLASASDAIVVGFQVRPSLGARKLAEKEGVEIKTYSIIYEAIDEIRAAIEGMLEPTKEEKILGNVEVREVYKISKVGTIAGCYVQEGKITRNNYIRLVRDGIVVYPTKEGVKGEVASLKRFKDDVKEVKAGFECGLNIKNYNDIREGDIIESYEINEVKQTLDKN